MAEFRSDGGDADVLIIGAGASGAAAAWRLAAAGFDVVCLEQGGWYDHARAPSLGADWELSRFARNSNNPNIRRLPEDYPVNDGDTPIAPSMYNAVGGSTIHWGGHFPRFHPQDFKVRSVDGVADDWPLTYGELEPYYDLNDRMMGVSGLAGDPANPPRVPRDMPPLAPGRGGEILARAFDRLGWHWWPTDNAINTRAREGRGACNNCGPCDLGCPVGARGSTDITYWPRALDAGARLRTHARVREILVDGQGRATGAVYFDEKGVERHQRARVVILAANGVGTPRLLLLSKSTAHPNGLANSSGLVGRNLMHHPTGLVTGLFAEDLEGYKGLFSQSIFSQEFYDTRPKHNFVRGFQLQILRCDGPVSVAAGGYLEGVPWGPTHHVEFAARFGRLASSTITAEDLPNERNTVTIDAELVDGDGIPAPKLTYAVDGNTRAMIDFGIARARELFAEAGALRTVDQPLLPSAGFHLMGTARMGDDAKTSVVDRWGRAHDVSNLFIIDGSVFVTCAALNPTSTIQALALRTADHIIETRGDLAS